MTTARPQITKISVMAVSLNVGVVGATGLVGGELLPLLERRKFPVGELRAFNSGRAEVSVRFRGRPVKATGPTMEALRSCGLVFMVSSDEVSERFAPTLAAAGVWVIDDSSAFRLDPKVPLVLPEVNAERLSPRTRLIAGPNCTLTGAGVACFPLIRAAGALAVRIASYQAVSGAGKAALAEFAAQRRGGAGKATALPRRIHLNLFPQVGGFDAAGDCSEERKVRAELRKIWGLPRLPVSATTVRVPVERGHSLAVWLELARPMTPARARALLKKAPGVRLWPEGDYPTPHDAAGTAPVHVGRVRQGSNPRELCLWIVSDNLLKGAALNSVQIAEHLLRKGWLGR